MINTYIIVWSLDNFGVTDFGLQGKTFFIFYLMSYPTKKLEEFIAYIKQSDQFDRSDKFSIWFFVQCMKPYAYMLTAELAPFTIWIMPVLMTLYLIDPEAFIDREVTLDDNTKITMPKEGLPTAVTEFYEINALSWNNVDYLYGADHAGIGLKHFIYIEIWACWQILTAVFAEPFMVITMILLSFSFVVILMYETLILGNSWSDRAQDIEVVGETKSMELTEIE